LETLNRSRSVTFPPVKMEGPSPPSMVPLLIGEPISNVHRLIILESGRGAGHAEFKMCLFKFFICVISFRIIVLPLVHSNDPVHTVAVIELTFKEHKTNEPDRKIWR
jgi:hypothetical protein